MRAGAMSPAWEEPTISVHTGIDRRQGKGSHFVQDRSGDRNSEQMYAAVHTWYGTTATGLHPEPQPADPWPCRGARG